MSRGLVRVTQLLQASCIVNCHQLGLLANQCPKAGALVTRNYCNIPSSTLATKASQRLSSLTGISTFNVRLSSANAAMSNTTASADPGIQEILNFWFDEIPREAWFRPPPELDLDTIITNRFQTYVEKAINTDSLNHWTSTPAGSLALVLCLDQFPRNIYRPGRHHQPGLSWSGDAKALQIAAEAIAKGYDREIQNIMKDSKPAVVARGYRFFFYLPFMHAEDLVAQIANVALFETLQQESLVERLELQRDGKDTKELDEEIEQMGQAVTFSAKHRDCVAALGRFPKRNDPLGRDHTEEEKEWLEKYPQGF